MKVAKYEQKRSESMCVLLFRVKKKIRKKNSTQICLVHRTNEDVNVLTNITLYQTEQSPTIFPLLS